MKRILFVLYLLSSWKADAAYLKARSVTIDHTKVGVINNTDQTNFTVLVCANGLGNCSAIITDFKTTGNGGLIQHTTTCCAISLTVPADLIFTTDSACTTKVTGWDIESYDATTGAIIAWVLIGTVSHTSDTVFYVCYDNSAVTTYQSTYTSAYDSHNKTRYHFNDGNLSSTTVHDSTINAGNATSAGTTADAAGQIGRAYNFAGGTTYSIANVTGLLPDTAHERTSECWFNMNGKTTAQEWHAYGSNGSFLRWAFFFQNDNKLYLEVGSNSDTIAWTPDSNWHHAVWVLPNGATNLNQALMYLDGTVRTQTNTSGTINTGVSEYQTNSIAGSGTIDKYLGMLDESSISDVGRTADWINTEYKNQSNPGTFLTISGSSSLSSVIHHKSTLQ